MGSSLDQWLAMQREQQERRRKEALSLISKAQPGQTAEELGLTPKAFKRVYGRAPQPGEILVPETPQTLIQKRTLAVLNSLPRAQIETLALSSIAKEMTGEGGITTPESFGIRTKTAETKAETEGVAAKAGKVAAGTQLTTFRTINDVVEKTAADFRRTHEQRKTARQQDPTLGGKVALGQQLMFGTTAEAEEDAATTAAFMGEIKREALKANIDPNHPIAKLGKRLGIDPAELVTSTVLGTNSLLYQMAELSIADTNRRTALANEMAKAAGEFSKDMGFKVNPTEIMAVWTETDPKKREKLGPIARLMEITADIKGRAVLTEAQEKGDPRARVLQTLDAVVRQTRDASMIEGISILSRRVTAELMMEADPRFGPRPQLTGAPDENKQAVLRQQAEWDKAMAGYMNILPGMKRKPGPGAVQAIEPMHPPTTISPQTIGPNLRGIPIAPSAPTAPTGSTSAPVSGITLPAGTDPQELKMWQDLINSWYMKPPGTP